MALKNVKYVLINENNEPIKNEDSSLDIKTAWNYFRKYCWSWRI
ncbi:hypothetical protein [Spiroplasma endosymbiont of Ammophila pubescens]